MNQEIKINRYIIHFLEKERIKTTANIDLSDSISSEDAFSLKLVEEVHNSINISPSLKNTKFKYNSTNDFSTSLENYLETSDDKDFILFSKSIGILKEKIEKLSFATGGYYLFIDYQILKKRYISVVLLRKREGLNITKDGNVFKLNSSENLNIDKIAMAFRLNFEIYLSLEDEIEKKNYVALITTQQDGEVSKYFQEWVNAGDLIKNAANTANLIKLIKSIDRPIDENGNQIYSSLGDFQKAIFEYSKSNKNKLVNLYDISKHFYGEENENKLMSFARECNITIDPEFKKDNSKWRSLITIKASVEGIELNVDFNKINRDEVDVQDDCIVIKSKQLAEKVKSQFIEEQKKNG